jgi:nucleoid-associated protein YgaU
MAPSDSLGGVAKLTVVALKKNVTETDSSVSLDDSTKVEAQFNPETLTLGKCNYWSFRTDMGDDVPEVIFSGGLAGTLDVKLLFDSTGSGDDVREQYLKLLTMSMVKPSQTGGRGQPTQVLVQWGEFMSFVCVIQSISQQFLLFKEDGTPLRAEVDVKFQQAWNDKKKGRQNPTSRSEVRRTWIVERGQRLDWIAYQAYGSTAAWRHIAETNQLLDPLALRPGQILKLPPLE